MLQDVAEHTAVMVDACSMPATVVTVSIRVDPAQHAAWVKAAAADDRSLTKWIARCCDRAAADAGFEPGPGTTRKPKAKRARKA